MASRETNNPRNMIDPSELENDQDIDREDTGPAASDDMNLTYSHETSSDSDSSESVPFNWQQKVKNCFKGKPRNKRQRRCPIHQTKKRDPVETEQRIEDITRRLRELEERSTKITLLKLRIDSLIAQHMQRQAEDDSNPDEE